MNTIEPPVLMSRIITFVFAAAFATVVVLVLAISNLLPLNRTQIFLLTTSPRENMEIEVQPYSPNDANIDVYKQNFIKEYIKLRNEVIPSVQVMRKKWRADDTGAVYTLSSPEIYADFLQTRTVAAVMSDLTELDRRCPVEFTNVALLSNNSDGSSTYEVKFRYFCTDNAGQTTKKDYTIKMTINFQKAMKWAVRLENPLGIYVSEYIVETGGIDPLDSAP
ncbi:MAG: type IV secretion system protein [Rickettsiales bacterium]|nr:type IV secretion system protein [Rickettsiales bacterium]